MAHAPQRSTASAVDSMGLALQTGAMRLGTKCLAARTQPGAPGHTGDSAGALHVACQRRFVRTIPAIFLLFTHTAIP